MNMTVMLLISVVLGLIPAAIAYDKDHSFWGWWLFGALLFIVALPVAITLKPAGQYSVPPADPEWLQARRAQQVR